MLLCKVIIIITILIVQFKLLHSEFLITFPDSMHTLPRGPTASGVILMLVISVLQCLVITCWWLLPLSRTYLGLFLYTCYMVLHPVFLFAELQFHITSEFTYILAFTYVRYHLFSLLPLKPLLLSSRSLIHHEWLIQSSYYPTPVLLYNPSCTPLQWIIFQASATIPGRYFSTLHHVR